jgi:hypothetical protein
MTEHHTYLAALILYHMEQPENVEHGTSLQCSVNIALWNGGTVVRECLAAQCSINSGS